MVAILHNVRSLHNVGSILRTADAAGVEKVYLCGITPAPVDRFGKVRPQLAKVSLGAERFIQWDGSARSPRAVSQLLERLKTEGYKIFAIEQSGESIPYFKVKVKSKNSKVALVCGNEVIGLAKPILEKSDKILEIPMSGQKESLNVAVAFGIVVFRINESLRKN